MRNENSAARDLEQEIQDKIDLLAQLVHVTGRVVCQLTELRCEADIAAEDRAIRAAKRH